MKKLGKLGKGILFLFILMVVAGVSSLLYLNSHLEEILREQIHLHTEDDLKIDFKDVSINVFSQSATVDGIEITKRDSGILAWSASLKRLNIEDLSVISLIKREGIEIDSVILDDVKAIFHEKPKEKSEPETFIEEEGAKSRLPLQINGIRISAGNFDYDPSGPEEIKGAFTFLLSNFQRDSSQKIDLKAQFLNSQFDIRFDQAISKDSLYVARIKSVKKRKGDSLFIDSLSLHPTQSLKEFTSFYGWNKGMLSVSVPEITTKLDLSGFPDLIEIPFCSVKGAALDIEKDNRWPLPERVTLMPQEMLSGLPIKFKLDSVDISDANLSINLIQESGKKASLTVQNVMANLSAQNQTDSLPAIHISADHSVMGKAAGSIETVYHYGEDSPFDYYLEMKDTKLDFMSEFLQKAIGIEITEGKLNRLNLDMKGNKNGCAGNLIFEYDNLSIAAVDKDTGKEKKMLNALANVLRGLVFWKENPAHGKMRNGTFSIERDVRKAFIAQWFEGLEAGLINVVAKIDPLKSRSEKEKSKKKKE